MVHSIVVIIMRSIMVEVIILVIKYVKMEITFMMIINLLPIIQ